jgi:drug/metabolite transporter (DMT)-like permease
MQNSELAALFAITAAVSWGVGDFFSAKAAKGVGPVLSMLVITLLDLPIFAVFYLLLGQQWSFSGVAFAYAVGAGLFFTLASTLFFKALEKGPVSIVSPIASMYPLPTALIAVAAFGARLTLTEDVGIVLVLIGVAAASGLLTMDKSKRVITPGVKLAIGTALVWGLSFTLLAQAISRVGWANASLFEIAASAVLMPFIAQFMKKDEVITLGQVKKAALNNFVMLSAVIGLVGIVAISFAISKSTASGGAVAAAISSMYPIITILLALHHFKEKVLPLALSGAVLGIVGVIVLSFA